MRTITIMLATASLSVLTACGADKDAAEAPATAGAEANRSLTEALAEMPNLATLSTALTTTGLDGVLAGKGGYTLLAPNDAAFGKLGEKAKLLSDPEHKAATAAILRGHILPGSLSVEDIGKAIDAAGGKAVTMRTVGDGNLSFTREGLDLIVTAADGSSAKIDRAGAKGALLPVDTVLRKI